MKGAQVKAVASVLSRVSIDDQKHFTRTPFDEILEKGHE